jgi:HEAT repeat protein
MKSGRFAMILWAGLTIALVVSFVVRRGTTSRETTARSLFARLRMGTNSAELKSLAQMGKAALPTFREALEAPSTSRRRKAAWALGQLGEASGDAVPDLLKSCDDEDGGVAYYSIQALGRIVRSRDDVVRKLMAELAHPTNNLSSAAAGALDDIEKRRKSEGLPSALCGEEDYAIAFLRSPVPNVRLTGGLKLLDFPSRSPHIREGISSLLHDTNAWVREQIRLRLQKE